MWESCFLWAEVFCKLRPIVCLDAFNKKWKFFCNMADEQGGGVGAVLLKGFQVSELAVFIEKVY